MNSVKRSKIEIINPFYFRFADVVLYLRTVLVTESLSERAEIQRQQLLEKLTKREISPVQAPYLDMSGRSKGKKINNFNPSHSYYHFCVCVRMIVSLIQKSRMISEIFHMAFTLFG